MARSRRRGVGRLHGGGGIIIFRFSPPVGWGEGRVPGGLRGNENSPGNGFRIPCSVQVVQWFHHGYPRSTPYGRRKPDRNPNRVVFASLPRGIINSVSLAHRQRRITPLFSNYPVKILSRRYRPFCYPASPGVPNALDVTAHLPPHIARTDLKLLL